MSSLVEKVTPRSSARQGNGEGMEKFMNGKIPEGENLDIPHHGATDLEASQSHASLIAFDKN